MSLPFAVYQTCMMRKKDSSAVGCGKRQGIHSRGVLCTIKPMTQLGLLQNEAAGQKVAL
jgi:hypothetical protein